MPEERPKEYGLESSPPDPPRNEASTGPSQPPPPQKDPQLIRQGVPLESEGPPSVKSLNVCPNCGAPMTASDALVCLRCGFDLKTMKVVATTTGVAEVDPDAASETGAKPLVQPVASDAWLPKAMAAVAGAILLAGYLAGMRGLFPTAGLSDQKTPSGTNEVVVSSRYVISFQWRMGSIAQEAALIAIWTGCGILALFFLAKLMGAKLGDIKAAAWRMLGIVCVMRLATMLSLPWAEWVIEAILQMAAFAGLSLVMFRLKPRDLPTLGLAMAISFVVIWLAARAIVLVTAAGWA